MKHFFTIALLGGVMAATPSLGSTPTNIEGYGDLAERFLGKRESSSNVFESLQDQQSQTEKSITTLLTKSPKGVTNKGDLDPEHFGLLDAEKKAEAFDFLARLQAQQNQASMLRLQTSVQRRNTLKYEDLFNFYSKFDLLEKILGLMTEVEATGFWDWNSSTIQFSGRKFSLASHFGEISLVEGHPVVRFRFCETLPYYTSNTNTSTMMGGQASMQDPVADHSSRVMKAFKDVFPYDVEEGSDLNKLQTAEKELSDFQVLARKRHAYVSRRVETLQSQEAALVKGYKSTLSALQTPNRLLILPGHADNPLTVALVTTGSSLYKMVPVTYTRTETEGKGKEKMDETTVEGSESSDLSRAQNILNQATLEASENITRKLEKAQEEQSLLSKVVGVLDELYNDIQNHGRLS